MMSADMNPATERIRDSLEEEVFIHVVDQSHEGWTAN